ncbi:HMCN1-like protein, partial [Mya arenaria]
MFMVLRKQSLRMYFLLSNLYSRESADPSIIVIPPFEQYAADYTFATPQYSIAGSSYSNYFMFIVRASDKNGLLLDGSSFPKSTSYTTIPGTDYVGGFMSISQGTHTIRHTSPIARFSGFIFGMAPAESYGMTTGMRLAPINEVRDGMDNDCDGRIDEEDCVDGDWGNWNQWSSACYYKSAYSGYRKRVRECDSPAPQYDGQQCDGDAMETWLCYSGPFINPVDGGYGQWTEWGDCSTTCSTGTSTRTRACDSPAQAHGGAYCSVLGPASESLSCNNTECPVDGNWGQWSQWSSACYYKSAYSGYRKRLRDCDNPAPQYNGNECAGDDMETFLCYSGPFLTVVILYGANGHRVTPHAVVCPASVHVLARARTPHQRRAEPTAAPLDWTPSMTPVLTRQTTRVQSGTQQRTRSCDNPAPQHGGADCTGIGPDTGSKACSVATMCPSKSFLSACAYYKMTVNLTNGVVPFQLTAGSQYGARGAPVRSRAGVAPPRVPGNAQTPPHSMMAPTVMGLAVVRKHSPAARLLSVRSWAACSATCGDGYQYRLRYCDNPAPSDDGSQCFGESLELTSCSANQTSCYDESGGSGGNGNLNGYSSNTCPSGFFTCQSGRITCIEESFVCDCTPDCDDGSDESSAWGQCSTICRNDASAMEWRMFLLAAVLM